MPAKYVNLKRCFIKTYGCQMNEHDSQKMNLLLHRLGYETVDAPEKADLILFNTCTIREKAYHKAISEIGRSAIFKKCRPQTLIGVCGCVAQQDGIKLAERYPHIDMVFGPDQINKLPNLIRKIRSSSPRPSPIKGEGDIGSPPTLEGEGGGEGGFERLAVALDLINTPDEYNFLNDVPDKVESGCAFVTVTKGCNCSCTYCIVPSVRGKEVSRAADDIIDEVRKLVRAGLKEVTLLGQNVTSYNPPTPPLEKGGKRGLTGLIKRLADETDILRIRFTSPNPRDVDEELIREFAENPKLCPHIHLPVQSGCNEVLKKMRRGYTREGYLEIVKLLREVRSGISITSDFIAGFPGETETQFEETIDLLKQVQFDSIFAFKYSQRPGTKAAIEFDDSVPVDVKEARLERVLSTQRKITCAKNEALVGQIRELLVTGYDRKNTGRLMGRLADNRIVNFAGNINLLGSIVRIRVRRALANSLEGEIIHDNNP